MWQARSVLTRNKQLTCNKICFKTVVGKENKVFWLLTAKWFSLVDNILAKFFKRWNKKSQNYPNDLFNVCPTNEKRHTFANETKISNKLKSRNTNCGNIFCYIMSLFRYRLIQLFFQGHLEMDARIQSIFSSQILVVRIIPALFIHTLSSHLETWQNHYQRARLSMPSLKIICVSSRYCWPEWKVPSDSFPCVYLIGNMIMQGKRIRFYIKYRIRKKDSEW